MRASAHHNNAQLRAFLDPFGFDYEFASATECYRSGRFDAALLRVLERYDDVMAIMLPSLREERAQTYSPFLPIHPRDRRRHAGADRRGRKPTPARIVWRDPETGERFETPVTGGHCQAAMEARLGHALGGARRRLRDGRQGPDRFRQAVGKIARALGGEPPEGFNYELFLDEKGQKISKSKGNGLTIDEWLAYGTPESLALFMYNKPREAKRLYFDVIPRHVDEYLHVPRAAIRGQEVKQQLGNPVWHIHAGRRPRPRLIGSGSTARPTITFAMLLNLVGGRQCRGPGRAVGLHPPLCAGRLAGDASAARRAGRLRHRATSGFREAGQALSRGRRGRARGAGRRCRAASVRMPADASAEAIQDVVYDVGAPIPRYPGLKAKGATPERPGVSHAWFNTLYQVLLGEERGPRFGSFVALYGVAETRALIAKALVGRAHGRARGVPRRARGRPSNAAGLLARPDDARHPGDVEQRQDAVLMRRVERRATRRSWPSCASAPSQSPRPSRCARRRGRRGGRRRSGRR